MPGSQKLGNHLRLGEVLVRNGDAQLALTQIGGQPLNPPIEARVLVGQPLEDLPEENLHIGVLQRSPQEEEEIPERHIAVLHLVGGEILFSNDAEVGLPEVLFDSPE